eukprot:g1712.t1
MKRRGTIACPTDPGESLAYISARYKDHLSKCTPKNPTKAEKEEKNVDASGNLSNDKLNSRKPSGKFLYQMRRWRWENSEFVGHVFHDYKTWLLTKSESRRLQYYNRLLIGLAQDLWTESLLTGDGQDLESMRSLEDEALAMQRSSFACNQNFYHSCANILNNHWNDKFAEKALVLAQGRRSFHITSSHTSSSDEQRRISTQNRRSNNFHPKSELFSRIRVIFQKYQLKVQEERIETDEKMIYRLGIFSFKYGEIERAEKILKHFLHRKQSSRPNTSDFSLVGSAKMYMTKIYESYIKVMDRSNGDYGGRFPLVKKYYEYAVDALKHTANSMDAAHWNRLAEAYALYGDSDGALRILDHLTQQFRLPAILELRVFISIASIYKKEQMFDVAASYLQLALSRKPKWLLESNLRASLTLEYGHTLEKLGRQEQAYTHYRDCFKEYNINSPFDKSNTTSFKSWANVWKMSGNTFEQNRFIFFAKDAYETAFLYDNFDGNVLLGLMRVLSLLQLDDECAEVEQRALSMPEHAVPPEVGSLKAWESSLRALKQKQQKMHSTPSKNHYGNQLASLGIGKISEELESKLSGDFKQVHQNENSEIMEEEKAKEKEKEEEGMEVILVQQYKETTNDFAIENEKSENSDMIKEGSGTTDNNAKQHEDDHFSREASHKQQGEMIPESEEQEVCEVHDSVKDNVLVLEEESKDMLEKEDIVQVVPIVGSDESLETIRCKIKSRFPNGKMINDWFLVSARSWRWNRIFADQHDELLRGVYNDILLEEKWLSADSQQALYFLENYMARLHLASSITIEQCSQGIDNVKSVLSVYWLPIRKMFQKSGEKDHENILYPHHDEEHTNTPFCVICKRFQKLIQKYGYAMILDGHHLYHLLKLRWKRYKSKVQEATRLFASLHENLTHEFALFSGSHMKLMEMFAKSLREEDKRLSPSDQFEFRKTELHLFGCVLSGTKTWEEIHNQNKLYFLWKPVRKRWQLFFDFSSWKTMYHNEITGDITEEIPHDYSDENMYEDLWGLIAFQSLWRKYSAQKQFEKKQQVENNAGNESVIEQYDIQNIREEKSKGMWDTRILG